jgi:L-ascorbate metabolism protein UlaG (beta-lactamase superfamily)
VRTVGAHRVVLIHWDDFFRPLDKPLRALPYAGDDLDVTMRVLSRLARQDGVALHLPTLWQRADPWN